MGLGCMYVCMYSVCVCKYVCVCICAMCVCVCVCVQYEYASMSAWLCRNMQGALFACACAWYNRAVLGVCMHVCGARSWRRTSVSNTSKNWAALYPGRQRFVRANDYDARTLPTTTTTTTTTIIIMCACMCVCVCMCVVCKIAVYIR